VVSEQVVVEALQQVTLTTAGCPMADILVSASECVLRALDGVKVWKVTLVWEPP